MNPHHSSRFRINRYNWLAQKFLTQHQYRSVGHLRRHVGGAASTSKGKTIVSGSGAGTTATNLVKQPAAATSNPNGTSREQPGLEATTSIVDDEINRFQHLISDHLTYIEALALMKNTSSRSGLNEILFNLQRLDLEKDGQHFLLLCRCLLYAGQSSSVVALFTQLLNKQIDTLKLELSSTNERIPDSSAGPHTSTRFKSLVRRCELLLLANPKNGNLNSCQSEDLIQKILAQIETNPLIGDPRLWLIFAKCLELEHALEDSSFAFKIATRLCQTGSKPGTTSASILNDASNQLDKLESQKIVSIKSSPAGQEQTSSHIDPILISNYHSPALEESKFILRNRSDFRSSASILREASSIMSNNNSIEILLALCMGALANSADQFARHLAILNTVESHLYSRQNPSARYNRLARRARLKLMQSRGLDIYLEDQSDVPDPRRTEPSLILAKSYLTLSKWSVMHESVKKNNDTTSQNQKHLDQLIESILDHEATCWNSSSLWNNLGLLFYSRGKLVGAFNCLLKANQIDPCNWRINFNLALLSHHVALPTRSTLLALASKNHRALTNNSHLLIDADSNYSKKTPMVERMIDNLIEENT